MYIGQSGVCVPSDNYNCAPHPISYEALREAVKKKLFNFRHCPNPVIWNFDLLVSIFTWAPEKPKEEVWTL